MTTTSINVIDGGIQRTANVDSARLSAFDCLRNDQRFNSIVQGRDAQESMSFLVSQLAFTENNVFERQYQPLQYEKFLPIDFSAGEWADTIRYEISDYVGQGKRTSGKGRDINKVDVGYAEKTFPVLYGNIGYDYSQEELRRAAHNRRGLPDTKLSAAVEAYRRHMNSVGLYGETQSGITGLFNNALVPQGSAPTGTWGSATPDNILKDINTAITNVNANTAYNDMPTTIVMAPSAFAYLAGTPRASGSDMSILAWVKANNVAKQQDGIDIDFQPGFGLNTGGAGGTRRMVAYVKSPDRLVMHIPLPLRFLAPQMVGLSIDVPGEYKYSGVEIRYPKSAYYMDGI